jgi:hypothetical protein
MCRKSKWRIAIYLPVVLNQPRLTRCTPDLHSALTCMEEMRVFPEDFLFYLLPRRPLLLISFLRRYTETRLFALRRLRNIYLPCTFLLHHYLCTRRYFRYFGSGGILAELIWRDLSQVD